MKLHIFLLDYFGELFVIVVSIYNNMKIKMQVNYIFIKWIMTKIILYKWKLVISPKKLIREIGYIAITRENKQYFFLLLN